MKVVITWKCIHNLLLKGKETVRMTDGSEIEFIFKWRDKGPPPGHRGGGCYVEEK